MYSFKTEGAAEWLFWLDVVLPSMVGSGLPGDASVHSIRICVIFISVTKAFLPTCENRPLPASSAIINRCVSFGTEGLGINLSSRLCHSGEQNENCSQTEESPAYSDNFSGVICINGRKWAAVT